jgi:hypothetical protein
MYMQDNALMSPSMMEQRALLVGCSVSGLQGGATIMMGYYLPIWFQAIRGADPQSSGLDMLPTMISQIIGSGLSGGLGKLHTTSYTQSMSLRLAVRRLHYVPPWAIGGSLLTVIGSALMTTFDIHTSEGK